MVDGFLRNPFDLGLSNVEAEEPETREGVLNTGGGGKLASCRTGYLPGRAAKGSSDGRDTVDLGVVRDAGFAGTRGIEFEVADALSGAGMVLLALLDSLEACSGLSSVGIDFVGMRLDC